MKKILRGKKTYIAILGIIVSLLISHFTPVEISAEELSAITEKGGELVVVARDDVWPTLAGLISSLAAIWARRRTDIEAAEDYIDGKIPRALNPKTGRPFRGALALGAGATILLLFPSCKSNDFLNSNMPEGVAVEGFVGSATAIGAEIGIGTHRIGLAFTYRNRPDPKAPVLPPAETSNDIPIIYPADEK